MARVYAVDVAVLLPAESGRWPATATYKDLFFLQPGWPSDLKGALRCFFAERAAGQPGVSPTLQPGDVTFTHLRFTELD